MMKKKAVSIALALLMCLTLITIPAFAAATLSLDRTTYGQGDTIRVTYSGITAEMEDAQAWIGLAKAGAAAADYYGGGTWEYVKQGSGTVEITAPTESGSFEMRLYQGYDANDETLVKSASVPLTIGAVVPVYPVKADFDWSLLDFTPGNRTFTGTWETNYTTLTMIQKGNSVTGQYPAWDDGRIDGTVVDGVLYGYWYEEPAYAPPHDAGQIVFFMHEDGKGFTGWWRYGNSGGWDLWSTGDRNVYDNSSWADEEIWKADAYDLIPDTLKTQDLKKPITRAEFAAVSVRAYEAMSKKKATLAAKNPFKDTNDEDVLKAYNTGITTGMTADEFKPDALINREQAATMLTRVLKKALIEGWNIGADGNFTLQYEKPEPFADDKDISSWAKDSVYFMAANKIINGMGNNTFRPKNATSQQEIDGYANATREQALIIAARMTENLKDKPLDYTEGGAQTATTPEPTPEPSATPTPEQPTTTTPSENVNRDNSLVGTWAAAWQGASLYYEFRSDGTFSYLRHFGYHSTAASTQPYVYLTVGHWRYSNNIVYLTQQIFTNSDNYYATEERGLNTYKDWRKLDDESLRIEMYEADSTRSDWALRGRHFINLEMVNEDGYSPHFMFESLPTWDLFNSNLWLGK